MLRMMNSCEVGRKLPIISPTTCSMMREWKTWRERVSIMTMKGKSERMTLAATEKA